MTLVALALGVACAAAGVGVLAAVCVPPVRRAAAAGIATVAVGVAGLVAGVAALSGITSSIRIGWLLPLSGVDLTFDPLAGWFMAVTGAVVAVAALYGIGYAGGGHAPTNRLTWVALPIFGCSLLLVPVAASVGTFLLCWELMAVTSLVLVVTEHAARAAVARAGLWYAAMTQAGFLALLIGLSVFSTAAGGQTFTALRAAHLSPAVRGLVFVLMLVGCGSKSGLVPLHVWLPKAHPEAPSPVSVMLSAGMVNLGVYMIVRVGFDLLHSGARWWWLLTLMLGAVSALYGIIQAAVATDLKVLLAYSTVENMGLIFLGVGAAGVLRASGADTLAGVALAAALLHVANHAGFKALLFAGAGSVLRATGSRDLDALGGLRSRMPATTALFAIGSLGGAALPLGAGFVSEWLLLQALVHAVPSGGILTAVAMPLAVAIVALTAGLAVATFVKALGTGFFARPRSPGAETAGESPPLMLTAMAIAAVGSTALALAPTVLGSTLSRIVTTSTGTPAPVDGGGMTLRLNHIGSSLSPLWIAAALTGGLLVTAVTIRVVAAGIDRRREIALWDCGAGSPTARMQYTATSFAEPVQRTFDDVLAPRTDITITTRAESRYIMERITYQREVPDRIEHHLYRPLIRGYRLLGQLAPKLGNGSVHRYLTYGFSGVIALLIVLAVFPVTTATVATVLQVLTVIFVAPLLTGLMRQIRARMEGRAGAGIRQPWRDLRKLVRRPSATPVGAGWPFRLAPLALAAASIVVAAVIPLLTTHSPLDHSADLFAVVGLLALGTVTLALAALDTGTAFGGMGSSRTITVLALVEPTILVAVFALSARVGSTNLAAIVTTTLHHPLRVASPASLLAAAALIVVIVAECGRIPVDNPTTHLELTMIHEAMTLEYAGADLALIELSAMMRLTVLLGLLASLFAPWGIATAGLIGLPLSVVVLVVKLAFLGGGLAAVEVLLAKLRLFRVPELLAGSFVLALLAVTSSYFLA